MNKLLHGLVGVALVVSAVANAQAVGMNVVSAGSAAGSAGSAGPAIIVSPPIPIAPLTSGFIQFNNLTVQSVSASNPPAEIFATNDIVVPMMGASTGATGGSVGTGAGTSAAMPPTAAVPGTDRHLL